MRFSDKDFINANEDGKNNLIVRVCALDSHNFISKDALVEMVRYQNQKIKQLDGHIPAKKI